MEPKQSRVIVKTVSFAPRQAAELDREAERRCADGRDIAPNVSAVVREAVDFWLRARRAEAEAAEDRAP